MAEPRKSVAGAVDKAIRVAPDAASKRPVSEIAKVERRLSKIGAIPRPMRRKP